MLLIFLFTKFTYSTKFTYNLVKYEHNINNNNKISGECSKPIFNFTYFANDINVKFVNSVDKNSTQLVKVIAVKNKTKLVYMIFESRDSILREELLIKVGF
jgi:hypothetical protein